MDEQKNPPSQTPAAHTPLTQPPQSESSGQAGHLSENKAVDGVKKPHDPSINSGHGPSQSQPSFNKLDSLGNKVLAKNPFELYQKQQTQEKGRTVTQKAGEQDNTPSYIQTLMRGKFSNSSLKPLRTYRGDVEKAIEKKKESVATIALAEKRRRQKRGEPQNKMLKRETILQNGLIVFLIITLVLTGVTSLFIFLYAKSQEQQAISTFYKKTIIPANREENILFSGSETSVLIRQKIDSLAEESEGEIVFISVNRDSTPVAADTLIPALSPSAPPYLVRSFGELDYMLGVIRQKVWAPLLFIKTDSFEIGFSGMLEWESAIKDEFGVIFSFSDSLSPSAVFEDKIIKNKDTRVLKNAGGEIVFVYGFLDKQTILISSNPEAWADILGRYFNSKLVQ